MFKCYQNQEDVKESSNPHGHLFAPPATAAFPQASFTGIAQRPTPLSHGGESATRMLNCIMPRYLARKLPHSLSLAIFLPCQHSYSPSLYLKSISLCTVFQVF